MHPPCLAPFIAEANALLALRIDALRHLSHAEAAALPEAVGREAALAGHNCNVTVFRQLLEERLCLVVTQVSLPGSLGIGSRHWERGLVFQPCGLVREATPRELENSGG